VTDDEEEEDEEAAVESVASEISNGIPDWPEWQPAMVTGRELEDTDDDLPIIVHDPQIWSKEQGTGLDFDGYKHWRVVRAMRARFPAENVSREYESFLCFESLIIHDRYLRNHRSCFRCWELEGRPLMIAGRNRRFGYGDLPGWVMSGEDRAARMAEFYRLMQFW